MGWIVGMLMEWETLRWEASVASAKLFGNTYHPCLLSVATVCASYGPDTRSYIYKNLLLLLAIRFLFRLVC
jgi:hypothetical protein